jgi:hypothetical protein
MVWVLSTTIGAEITADPNKPMSTSPQETSDLSTNAPAHPERIVAFRHEDGAVVIYDEREHTAWLQSSDAVALTDAR